jgi:hypothetical protein
MTNDDGIQPALPGLELDAELGGKRGALRNAVVITLAALEDAKLLEPRHTATAQLALTLADAVERGTRGGRASAAAMASAQLLAALDALPKPSAMSTDELWAEMQRRLAEGDLEQLPT